MQTPLSVLDLMAAGAHANELVAYSQVRGMRGVLLQRVTGLEVGDENHVAGVVHGAGVKADLETSHAGNVAAQAFEGLLDLHAGLVALLG